MEDNNLKEDYYEIDLRRYITALFRWWWAIGLSAALAGAAAFFVSILIKPTYEAKAGVVALHTQIEISLGSIIQSTTDLDFNLAEAAKGVTEAGIERRLASMVGLVRDGAIAEQVSEDLKDLLTEDERQPDELLDKVTGQLQDDGNSETIEIVVSYDDPEKAAAIANAWGQVYETHVNQIYGEASVLPFVDIEQQLSAAVNDYDQAQEVLLSFLEQEDRIDELNRQIVEDVVAIDKLRSGRQDYNSTVIDNQVEAQKRLHNFTVASQLNSSLTVFERQSNEVTRKLNLAYTRKYLLENLIEEAQLMREQLVEGGIASARSNVLALVAFKLRVFSSDDGFPFNELDLQLPSVSALTPESNVNEQIIDLDGLISAMGTSLSEQEKIIEEESAALLSGNKFEFLDQLSIDSVSVSGSQSEEALLGLEEWEGLLPYSTSLGGDLNQEIQRLEDHVRELKAEVEKLSKEKIKLKMERDLLWETYSALNSKAQEIGVTKSTVARFSSYALPPMKPESRNVMLNTALALVVGLMLGVGAAVMGEYMDMEAPAPLPVILRFLKRDSGSSADRDLET